MRRARWLAGTLALAWTVTTWAVAPPLARPIDLNQAQQSQVDELNRQLQVAWNAGKFETAAAQARQIADLRQRWQGKGHWQTIDAGLVAEDHQRLARVPAEGRAELVAASRRMAEGLTLAGRGRHREAEEALREALAAARRTLGEAHPYNAVAFINLASCLGAQGRHAEALPLLHKALAIYRKALGENHARTATGYNNVGYSLNVQGRPGEGLPFYEKALAIDRRALGEGHPQAIQTLNNLAACLNQLGRRDEARPLYGQALSLRRWALGEAHLLTAQSYNNLAYCLQEQARYAQALPLHEKALAIRRTALGEEHAETALSYNNVAHCLGELGRHAEALPLYRKALAGFREALGEAHPRTATASSNLALCLDALGRHAEALPLHHKALAVHRKKLGEEDPRTVRSCSNLGFCLGELGRHAEALPLYQKALAIRRRTLGEADRETALSYNNVAACLQELGRHALALPLYHKALAIRRGAVGETHRDTATSYGNLAFCLQAQGNHAQAQVLYEKALAIRRKALGEDHFLTADSYHNLAYCLAEQGRHEEALPFYEKALAIRRTQLGESHPHTAYSYSGVAGCLGARGQHDRALTLLEKALRVRQEALGESHPLTARACSGVASCLDALGRHVRAQPLHEKALAASRQALGEEHPFTADCAGRLALCHYRQGHYAEAVKAWEEALLGEGWGRLEVARSGFGRSLARAEQLSAHAGLAACLVRLDEPGRAWEHAEADLARGLLDELAGNAPSAADAEKLARLGRLDEQLLSLAHSDLDEPQRKRRAALARERRELHADLARAAARRARARVLPLADIQKRLPADTALVFWFDAIDQRLGCVVRPRRGPHWVKLPGSGKGDAWTEDDESLPARAGAALADPATDPAALKRLLAALARQRLTPLEPYLQARDELPAVKRLLVVSSGRMAGLPVDALALDATVSYVPSGSVYARLMEKHRPLEASSLLVLADPVFRRAPAVAPAAPPHGLLLTAVLPGGPAARAGLNAGDVLLEYNAVRLGKPDDLRDAAGDEPVPLRFWREGQETAGRIRPGRLGVTIDPRPVAAALAAWHGQPDTELAVRGRLWEPLPGTRLEARALKALVPSASLLLGSRASEQSLNQLASADKLRMFRILHLASHALVNAERPEETALILAQDRLPARLTDEVEAALSGHKPLDGRLTVGAVLRDWKLDADLVVLSACESGQGKQAPRDGVLGFSQALLQKGARSVVLSRWKVDDAAAALLMGRFYENLLGKRDGPKGGMERAAALAEARRWLSELGRADAEKRLGALVDGLPRGERGSFKKGLPLRKPGDREEDRPFAHPYYWAAFVLIGDPK